MKAHLVFLKPSPVKGTMFFCVFKWTYLSIPVHFLKVNVIKHSISLNVCKYTDLSSIGGKPYFPVFPTSQV